MPLLTKELALSVIVYGLRIASERFEERPLADEWKELERYMYAYQYAFRNLNDDEIRDYLADQPIDAWEGILAEACPMFTLHPPQNPGEN